MTTATGGSDRKPDAKMIGDVPDWTRTELLYRWTARLSMAIAVLGLLLDGWGGHRAPGLFMLGMIAELRCDLDRTRRVLAHAILKVTGPDVYLQGWNDAFDKVKHLIDERIAR